MQNENDKQSNVYGKSKPKSNKGPIIALSVILAVLLLAIILFLWFARPWERDNGGSSSESRNGTVNVENLTMSVGESRQLEVPLSENEALVSYSSDFPEAISVNETGMVTVNAKHNAIVTAEVNARPAQSGDANEEKIYYEYHISVADLTASKYPDIIELRLGQKEALAPFLQEGRLFAAISADDTIVTVSFEDSRYMIEGVAEGSTSLTITYGIVAENSGQSIFLPQDSLIVDIVVTATGDTGAGIHIDSIRPNLDTGSGSNSSGGNGGGGGSSSSNGGGGTSSSSGGGGSSSSSGGGGTSSSSSGGGGTSSSSSGGGGSSSSSGGGGTSSSSSGGGGTSSSSSGGGTSSSSSSGTSSSSNGGGIDVNIGGGTSSSSGGIDVTVGGSDGLGVHVGEDGVGVTVDDKNLIGVDIGGIHVGILGSGGLIDASIGK